MLPLDKKAALEKIIDFDCKHINTHGGSLRVYVKNFRIKYETFDDPKYYSLFRFMDRVRKKKYKTIMKILKHKIKGKKIIGYGAPAKSTTLLNYFGIGKDMIDCIIDDSSLKQGFYTPGTHIPIVKKASKFDLVHILAWNFSESIKKAHPEYVYI